ncbi:MAG: LytTR family transcriptional regulator DNA-binding domain-containing protein [Coprobacillus sp.]
MREKIVELIQKYQSLHIECTQDVSAIVEDIVSELEDVSIVDENEGMYDYMKVKEYLNFFAELTGHSHLIEQSIEFMHLSDFLHIKIEKCTYQQKKRVLIAKEIIKDSQIYYLKEPLSQLDEESIRMILDWLEYANKHDKHIISTSRSLKEVCLCDGYHVSIFNQNINPIEEESNDSIDEDQFSIQKISVKANERIFLFNPEEIDYIEASEGKSQVVVRNETYTSPLSMDELEEKLHRFGFYRSHRSYLINMQKVTQIVKWTRNSYSLKLMNYDQITIPLSKTKVQEMKNLYQF